MKITTYRVSATLPLPIAHALADLVEEDPAFEGRPLDLLEIDPERVNLALFFDARPPRALVARLDRLAKAASAPKSTRFAVTALQPTDWVAESLASLPPVRAGRFLVHGSHDRDATRANDIAIEIEAGLAFGTGHHGTTVGCLTAIGEELKRRPIACAADIGTGTGVLAIAIARAARVPVVATDLDPVAVRVADENIRLNGAAAYVGTATAAGADHRLYRRNGPFDLIVANILADPLARLAPSIRRIAAPGAAVILSGLLPHQRRWLVAAYRNAGFRLVGSFVVDGWLTLRFRCP